MVFWEVCFNVRGWWWFGACGRRIMVNRRFIVCVCVCLGFGKLRLERERERGGGTEEER